MFAEAHESKQKLAKIYKARKSKHRQQQIPKANKSMQTQRQAIKKKQAKASRGLQKHTKANKSDQKHKKQGKASIAEQLQKRTSLSGQQPVAALTHLFGSASSSSASGAQGPEIQGDRRSTFVWSISPSQGAWAGAWAGLEGGLSEQFRPIGQRIVFWQSLARVFWQSLFGWPAAARVSFNGRLPINRMARIL